MRDLDAFDDPIAQSLDMRKQLNDRRLQRRVWSSDLGFVATADLQGARQPWGRLEYRLAISNVQAFDSTEMHLGKEMNKALASWRKLTGARVGLLGSWGVRHLPTLRLRLAASEGRSSVVDITRASVASGRTSVVNRGNGRGNTASISGRKHRKLPAFGNALRK